MDTEGTRETTDRATAARLLDDAETGGIRRRSDVLSWAGIAAGVGIAMGLVIALVAISMWFMLPYAVVIVGLVLWHQRVARSAPRGAGWTYGLGVAGSGLMIGVVLFALGGPLEDASPGALALGGLAIAAPALVAAAVIVLRGAR